MDAIDRVVMNARLHHLGMAARHAEPALKLAILTCMDARVDPAALLGLHPGDAHLIRNAGGRATKEAEQALAVSQALLGTREVMVLHHTECAMGRMSASELASRITAATNHPFHEELATFSDHAAALAEDVARLRAYPSLVHRDRIRGYLYDLAADSLKEIAGQSG